MTNFIPVFPLGIVVYPGEQLNLHIFEPRYKQLIQDCYAEAKPFGIPTVLVNGMAEMGTLVEITEITEVYEDGKMDIKTRGLKIFRMLELIKTLPHKAYSGAIVSYPDNNQHLLPAMAEQIIGFVRQLHKALEVTKQFSKPDTDLASYDIAHHAGLSLNEEYELLGLMQENQRLEYLKRHLKKVLAVVTEMDKLKDRIQLNGHFRELKGFNL